MEQEVANYKREIEEGKWPSELRTKKLTSSKTQMVEVDFTSSFRPPMMTSAQLTLRKDSGQTSKKSKSSASLQTAVIQSNICDQVMFSMEKN